MQDDTDKIDDAVPAPLQLTLHNTNPAWKGHAWAALGRLHDKGVIDDPVGKQKSVALTPEGSAESARLFETLFTKAGSRHRGHQ